MHDVSWDHHVVLWRVFGWMRACALARQRAPDGQRVGGECITLVRFRISDEGSIQLMSMMSPMEELPIPEVNKCAWLSPSFCSG